MFGVILKRAGNLLRRFGFGRDRVWRKLFPEHAGLEARLPAIIERVRPFTMTSRQRIRGLCRALAYVESRGIAGDIVECGVWRGGSMMAAALTLLCLGGPSRRLWLFDTFAGMSTPTAADRDSAGRTADAWLQDPAFVEHCICPLDDVRANLVATGYDPRLFTFVAGKVEETLPAAAPEPIALLRLDTDWYESTYHELVHLYPRLASGGVLIIDDYGEWQGSRQAVDAYFAAAGVSGPLLPLGNSARIHLKSA